MCGGLHTPRHACGHLPGDVPEDAHNGPSRSASRPHHRGAGDTALVALHAPIRPGNGDRASTRRRRRRTSGLGRRQAGEDRGTTSLAVDLRWCRAPRGGRTARATLAALLSAAVTVVGGSCTDRSAPAAPDTPTSTSRTSDAPGTPSGVTLPTATPSTTVRVYPIRPTQPPDTDVGPMTAPPGDQTR